MTAFKWTEENTEKLLNIVGQNRDVEITAEAIHSAEAVMGVEAKRIAAKLRKMEFTVASLAKVKGPSFSDEDTEALVEFLNTNSGQYTFKELAEVFLEGKYTAKMLQGKCLHLGLIPNVKRAEKVEAASDYTPEMEAQFIKLAGTGNSIEQIAEALNMPVPSIRGKALSLLHKGEIEAIPHTQNKVTSVDPLTALGENIANMTLADIAEKTGKSERGIKTALTRRGIKVVDYDGASKHEKALARREATV